MSIRSKQQGKWSRETIKLLIKGGKAVNRLRSPFFSGLTLKNFFDILKIEYPFNLATMSITYQPKRKKRKRTHGFRKRKKSQGGKRVLKRRQRKKRWRLTV